jgi:2-hydroxychromene-2-carboxylate isomerase
MTTPPVPIEVYADITCPFAYVGLRTLTTTRAAASRLDIPIVVLPWPLELVNGQPLDPTTTAAHVAELRSQIAPALFTGFDPLNFPATTLPALALAHIAYTIDPAVGLALSQALRTALFEHGLNIADPATLRALAYEYALPEPTPADAAAVLELYHAGQARSVLGSPHFFYRDYAAFCPSLAIAHDPTDAITLTFDQAALAEFLTYCFPPQQPPPTRTELLSLLAPRIAHLATLIGATVARIPDPTAQPLTVVVDFPIDQRGVLPLLRLRGYLTELLATPVEVTTPELCPLTTPPTD